MASRYRDDREPPRGARSLRAPKTIETYVPSLSKALRCKSLERLKHRRNEKPNLPAAERRPWEHRSTRMSGVCLPATPRRSADPLLRQGSADVVVRLELAPEGDLGLAACDLPHHPLDLAALG